MMTTPDPKQAREQRMLFAQINQAKLRPQFMALLEAGLSRKTIESCIREHVHGTGVNKENVREHQRPAALAPEGV
jgi:hypothetical protein